MNPCWSEGELRAYLDGELAPEAMERLSAHLPECPACAGSLEEMRERARRVAMLLEGLSETTVARPAAVSIRRHRPVARWAAAAAALAACLTVAVTMRREDPRPVAPVEVKQAAQVEKPAPAVEIQPQPQTKVRKSRSAVRRPRPRPAAQPDVKYFMALDNEPFDTGVVMRVALGPAEVPADVVFSPDGRPRAVRLVNFSKGGSR